MAKRYRLYLCQFLFYAPESDDFFQLRVFLFTDRRFHIEIDCRCFFPEGLREFVCPNQKDKFVEIYKIRILYRRALCVGHFLAVIKSVFADIREVGHIRIQPVMQDQCIPEREMLQLAGGNERLFDPFLIRLVPAECRDLLQKRKLPRIKVKNIRAVAFDCLRFEAVC